MTAAQFHAIGERVKRLANREDHGEPAVTQAAIDRAELYAALERLVQPAGEKCFAIVVPGHLLYLTRDAAIDALLGDA